VVLERAGSWAGGVEKAVVAFVVRTVRARAATFSRANLDVQHTRLLKQCQEREKQQPHIYLMGTNKNKWVRSAGSDILIYATQTPTFRI